MIIKASMQSRLGHEKVALTCLFDYDSSFLGYDSRFKTFHHMYVAGYRERIDSGEITLGDLASTESDCSSARNKGDLGFFGPGQMQSKESCQCNRCLLL